MENRIKKIQRILAKKKLSGMLITNPVNINYLSGFNGSFGYVLVTKKKALLFTDFRYEARAGKLTHGLLEVMIADKTMSKMINEYVKKFRIKKLGFEAGDLTVLQKGNLKKEMPGVALVPLSGAVEELRVVKEASELRKLSKAAKLTDETFAAMIRLIKKSRRNLPTELALAWELEKYVREVEQANLAFPSIVASGPNSAIPHHEPGKRRLREGDFVKMDFGVKYKGYHADMTRTIILGVPSKRQQSIYEAVLLEQEKAIKTATKGISGRELDESVRQGFRKEGLLKAYRHSLGHGVGLAIHELPTLSSFGKIGKEKLPGNTIVTIEPGLYFPGWGGVRIEDMVVVSDNGGRLLTHSPKELKDMIIKM